MLYEKLNSFLNSDERSDLITMIEALDRSKKIALNEDNFTLSIRNLSTK